MTDHRDELRAVLDDARRILTLGKALSPAQPAAIALRTAAGFAFGHVDVEPAGDTTIVEADADGRIGNLIPLGFPPETATVFAQLFATRPNARAAILIRAPRLAAWGRARRPLPVRYFQMFGYTRAASVALAAPNPAAVRETLASDAETPALLLTDGRTLIWAASPARAVRLVLSLEEAAHVTALADPIGGARDYPAEAREKIHESLRAQQRR